MTSSFQRRNFLTQILSRLRTRWIRSSRRTCPSGGRKSRERRPGMWNWPLNKAGCRFISLTFLRLVIRPFECCNCAVKISHPSLERAIQDGNSWWHQDRADYDLSRGWSMVGLVCGTSRGEYRATHSKGDRAAVSGWGILARRWDESHVTGNRSTLDFLSTSTLPAWLSHFCFRSVDEDRSNDLCLSAGANYSAWVIK